MSTPLLSLRGVTAYYGAIQALKGVDLESTGEIVTLIGANGAGKSTLMMTICGNPRARTGQILFDGQDITTADPRDHASRPGPGARGPPHLRPHDRVRKPADGRRMVRMKNFDRTRDLVFTLFPRLKERLSQRGGTLSGGEQQMLAIGRALMSQPRLLLLDEPSLGLAPLVVRQIFGAIRQLNRETGLTVLLVEQNAFQALRLAHRGYVLVNGSITMAGTGADLLARPEIRAAYLEGAHSWPPRTAWRASEARTRPASSRGNPAAATTPQSPGQSPAASASSSPGQPKRRDRHLVAAAQWQAAPVLLGQDRGQGETLPRCGSRPQPQPLSVTVKYMAASPAVTSTPIWPSRRMCIPCLAALPTSSCATRRITSSSFGGTPCAGTEQCSVICCSGSLARPMMPRHKLSMRSASGPGARVKPNSASEISAVSRMRRSNSVTTRLVGPLAGKTVGDLRQDPRQRILGLMPKLAEIDFRRVGARTGLSHRARLL